MRSGLENLSTTSCGHLGSVTQKKGLLRKTKPLPEPASPAARVLEGEGRIRGEGRGGEGRGRGMRWGAQTEGGGAFINNVPGISKPTCSGDCGPTLEGSAE